MVDINVINMHLTDKCNFRCKFCFVVKENKELTLDEAKALVFKAKEYFDSKGLKGRINLAGGEPLCYKHLEELIDYIYKLGIEVSLITNGSLLTSEFIKRNSKKLSMIGISCDSVNDETNRYLGRCSKATLDKDSILSLSKEIKKNGITLKINTCVSKCNLNEDLSDLIMEINPDRFKILQVVPDNEFSKLNLITKEEFDEYILKYSKISNKVIEYNSEMEDSYLIINSEGVLATNNRHSGGINLLDNDITIADALTKLKLNTNLFGKRYKKSNT